MASNHAAYLLDVLEDLTTLAVGGGGVLKMVSDSYRPRIDSNPENSIAVLALWTDVQNLAWQSLKISRELLAKNGDLGLGRAGGKKHFQQMVDSFGPILAIHSLQTSRKGFTFEVQPVMNWAKIAENVGYYASTDRSYLARLNACIGIHLPGKATRCLAFTGQKGIEILTRDNILALGGGESVVIAHKWPEEVSVGDMKMTFFGCLPSSQTSVGDWLLEARVD